MTEVKDKMVPASCPECEIGPFTRNHYFTGKLLVERDFRQEQAYYMDKLRLHTQRLHGWGVVCGLKVTQHETPACQNRFVCIEPGLAVDCCGHDILVTERDCIDLTQLDALKTLAKNNDTSPKTLQVCIRYKECPTEPIPVLYDDCGCDDTQCAPNRILESYQVDVNVVTETTSPSPDSPALNWKNTINVAHASRVVYHDATRRLYVLTDDAQGFVYQVSTDNFTILSSHALASHGLAMAVSNDGTRVYVVAEGANPGALRQLHVLDVTQAGLPLVQANPLDIPKSANSVVLPAVSPDPDNRLVALVAAVPGVFLRWDTDIDTKANPKAPKAIVSNLPANQQSFALSTDGSTAYIGGTDNNIQVLVLATATATAITPPALPGSAVSTVMAVVRSSSGDMLAVVDKTNSKLYLVNPAAPSLVGTVALHHPPVGEVIAPDNHWAYVVEQDAGKSYLEPVDLFSLQLGQNVVPGAALPLGVNSQAPVITSSGSTLFVPFTGNLATPTDGGVAIIDVTESDCCGKIWNSLNGCPSCDTPNCVVLATIKNYVLNDAFEDQTDPPADPATDTANHVARIDNREGRRLLPSTSTLTEIIRCLCTEGAGIKGPKGDPGLPGRQGDPGQNGNPGQGLEQGLTRIAALSWVHNTPTPLIPVTLLNPPPSAPQTAPGVVIGFSGPVHVNGATAGNNPIDQRHIFQVLADDPLGRQVGMLCRCGLTGSVVPVTFTANANNVITAAQEVASGDAPGIAFLPDAQGQNNARESSDIWIQLHCDFVIDVNGKAVDGPFLRMQLPTGDHMGKATTPPAANPFGLQGGLFESWFKVIQAPSPAPVRRRS